MKVWDMHCDTLAELRYAQQAGKPKSFLHNDLMMDLERMKQGDYLLQCMACFVHLEPEREKSPLLACLEEIDIFYRLLEQYPDDLMQVRTAADIQTLLTSGKRGMMLTVEEGGACLDSLGALRNLYRLGVRMMTLTWNFKNGLAEPNIVPGTDDLWPRHGRKGLPDWPELLRFLPGYKPRPQPGQEPHHRYGPPRPLYYG